MARFRRRRWRDPSWAHCRGLTNRIIDIAADIRFPNAKYGSVRKRAWRLAIVASRKRWATFGNPASDHYKGNQTADAVDFRYFRKRIRYARMRQIMRRLGVENAQDYGNYTVEHNGRLFRVQPIA
jgi:hypothetical protein